MISFLDSHRIQYKFNQDLKQVTWIHRGGVAKLFIIPDSLEQLQLAYKEAHRNNIKPVIVGHTSNIYFKNDCSIKCVITTKKLTSYKIEGNRVYAECGAHMKKIAHDSVSNGLVGLEGLVNLPGTASAAIINNAGCYGSVASTYFEKCDVVYPDGTIGVLTAREMAFSHRNSTIKSKTINACVLGIYWNLPSGDVYKLEEKSKWATKNRKLTQDAPSHNLGSTYCRIKPNMLYKSAIYLAAIINKLCVPFDKHDSIPSYIKQQNRVNRIVKKLLLFCTGNRNIDKYVSDYNIICFRWLDQDADQAFEQYQRFVSRISQECRLEIEVYE